MHFLFAAIAIGPLFDSAHCGREPFYVILSIIVDCHVDMDSSFGQNEIFMKIDFFDSTIELKSEAMLYGRSHKC